MAVSCKEFDIYENPRNLGIY